MAVLGLFYFSAGSDTILVSLYGRFSPKFKHTHTANVLLYMNNGQIDRRQTELVHLFKTVETPLAIRLPLTVRS